MFKRCLRVPALKYNVRMNHSLLQVNESDGVRSITMVDSKTRNSLSMAMMDSLITEIKRNEDDKSLRAIVLSSTGPVFSAGHNLKELSADKSYESKKLVFDKCHELIRSIIYSPLPVISKIDGLSAAAGLQLSSSCDLSICSEKSTFSTPGASFGIFCNTPGIAISRVIPRMHSSYMLLTGLPVSAQEALRIGLVCSVVPSDELDNELNRICDAIKSKSREVVSFGKKFFYKQLELDLNKAYEAGATAMADNLQLPDGKEGIQSFIEKRKPKWSN